MPPRVDPTTPRRAVRRRPRPRSARRRGSRAPCAASQRRRVSSASDAPVPSTWIAIEEVRLARPVPAGRGGDGPRRATAASRLRQLREVRTQRGDGGDALGKRSDLRSSRARPTRPQRQASFLRSGGEDVVRVDGEELAARRSRICGAWSVSRSFRARGRPSIARMRIMGGCVPRGWGRGAHVGLEERAGGGRLPRRPDFSAPRQPVASRARGRGKRARARSARRRAGPVGALESRRSAFDLPPAAARRRGLTCSRWRNRTETRRDLRHLLAAAGVQLCLPSGGNARSAAWAASSAPGARGRRGGPGSRALQGDQRAHRSGPPGDAPNSAPTFPRNARSVWARRQSGGRPSRSRSSAGPGMELLYSGPREQKPVVRFEVAPETAGAGAPGIPCAASRSPSYTGMLKSREVDPRHFRAERSPAAVAAASAERLLVPRPRPHASGHVASTLGRRRHLDPPAGAA